MKLLSKPVCTPSDEFFTRGYPLMSFSRLGIQRVGIMFEDTF